MAVHDEAVGRIVGRDAYGHFISDDHTDIKAAHFSAKFRGYFNRVFELHFVDTTGGGIHYSVWSVVAGSVEDGWARTIKQVRREGAGCREVE